MKESRRMSTCNLLDLQTLESQPILPKILPDHCTGLMTMIYYCPSLEIQLPCSLPGSTQNFRRKQAAELNVVNGKTAEDDHTRNVIEC